ncbi:hypothetical protein L1987_44170 [Smallanthus sonchifolius]|uniref:Uncharacterized protein n=1 Tax=Smallanthus sonchifolius TaxID=185202 RepID=A0ACB9GNP5_9ASTR|nr:hypothetical protein L1987_44170 [Smallanthus sonchifolius]
MAAAPIIIKASSDLQPAINESETPKSPQTNVTIAQLPMSKPSPPAPLTPSSELSGKRKRLKPARFEFSSVNAEKKHSPSKDKAVQDHSRESSSLGKEKKSKGSNASARISQTMIRAREIQSTLGNEHPSFIKTMLRSHVTSCFWMGLPVPFCRSFLPKDDSLMVTEDENGEQCKLKFIAYKFGLSGGWRKFAIQHKLLEGDVLIFQLVESCKFKVYIVRANDSKEVDGAVNIINHDAHVEHTTSAMVKTIRALTNLAFESEDAKRYVEAKEEQSQNAPEMKILEAKLVELYESKRKIDGVVDELKEKAERCEIEFQKKVDAPW